MARGEGCERGVDRVADPGERAGLDELVVVAGARDQAPVAPHRPRRPDEQPHRQRHQRGDHDRVHDRARFGGAEDERTGPAPAIAMPVICTRMPTSERRLRVPLPLASTPARRRAASSAVTNTTRPSREDDQRGQADGCVVADHGFFRRLAASARPAAIWSRP